MGSVEQICIFGGMHGNEMSGVHLVKHWKKDPAPVTRSNFQTHLCIANPKAVEIVRRYCDVDLNRQMSPEILNSQVNENTPYEIKRVKELKAMLSPGGEIGECQYIIDLHNTTANTKVCLIHSNCDDFTLHWLHYIKNNLQEALCYILTIPVGMQYPDSRSLGKYGGVGIEVGPQPQGVLRADILIQQKSANLHALDFIEKYNNGEEFSEANFHAYKVVERVNFPRDKDGCLTAMIHPNFQDQDWKPLTLDDPVFLSFADKVIYLKDVIKHEDPGPFYPMFINEAAYYEKGTAFCLTMKYDSSIGKLSKE